MSEPSQPFSYTFQVVERPEMAVASYRHSRPYWLHLLLLLLTMLTTLIVGAQLYENFRHGLPAFTIGSEVLPLFSPRWIWEHPSRLIMGIPFSAALMTILLAHEMGHFLLCERYGVEATLPFFLPAPTLIGTMGAFIRIQSPIRSRKALFDIGIAGPIAGFAFAAPLLLIGLVMSRPMSAVVSKESFEIGFPLVFHMAHRCLAAFGIDGTPLHALSLHPVAVAAWVGMLATALNLLPGGQLDGGHIVYAVAPRAHKWVTRVTVTALAALSGFWLGWLLWAVFLGFTGWRHPAVPVWPGLNGKRKALAFVGFAMLLITIVPAPILGQGWLAAK